MDRDGIFQLLDEIEAENITEQGEWVMCSCPLAPFTHESGGDSSPSFGISIKEANEQSIFHCFTCKEKGPVSKLFEMLYEFEGDSEWLEYAENIKKDEKMTPLPKWEKRKKRKKKPSTPMTPLDKDQYMDIYEPAKNHWYLNKRHVPYSVVKKAQLQIDPDDYGSERVLFPVFGLDHELYGFAGRLTHDEEEGKFTPKVRNYLGLKTEQILLGLENLKDDDKFVVLVEGLFDYTRMLEYDIPALAAFGSHLSDGQAKILKSISKPVYMLFDNDRAGFDGREAIVEQLFGHVPIRDVRYMKGMHKYDPGMLTKKQVTKMLQKAELVTDIDY